MTNKVDILGINFELTNLESAVLADVKLIQANVKCQHLVFANAYSACIYQTHALYKQSVQKAQKIYADGISIKFASHLLSDSTLDRVAGPDYMNLMLDACKRENISCFFVGCANTKELVQFKMIVQNKYGEHVWAGGYSPSFGDWSDSLCAEIVQKINASQAQILWMGVGTPKQDVFITRIQEQLHVSIAAGVGAAFDFANGKVKRAPQWVNHLGIEWLHRLVKDPRRLWKRYLFGNVRFIYLVLKQYITHKIRTK